MASARETNVTQCLLILNFAIARERSVIYGSALDTGWCKADKCHTLPFDTLLMQGREVSYMVVPFDTVVMQGREMSHDVINARERNVT